MTGKYPADIVEKVAKATSEHGDLEYVEGVLPDGPWGGWGWVCKCGKVLDPSTIVPVPAGVSMVDWWLAKHTAIAALDALGLTVTEESTYRGRYPDVTLVHRTVLHAETPWVEVPDAE